MNFGVIGGYGLLGSTTAFLAGSKNLFDKIYLIGRKQNLLKSHVMDMAQSICPVSDTIIEAGDYDALGECDCILFTASAPEQAVVNRNEYLFRNVGIVDEIAHKLKNSCDNKIVICATNPVDVFNYHLWRKTGWQRRKFLGFNANDSLRLRWALSLYSGKPYKDFEAYVIGEHGEHQVPLMSSVKCNGEPMPLDDDARAQIQGRIANYFREFQALDSKRTSGWTSSVSLTNVLEAIVTQKDDIITCSAVLDGEFGEKDVSVGVPLLVDNGGIKQIVELPMTEAEQEQLHKAAQSIRAYIERAIRG